MIVAAAKRKSSTERVWWTEEEQLNLIDMVYVARLNYPGDNLTSLCNRVQEQWPESRRRKIASLEAQAPWLIAGIEAKIKELREKAAKPTHVNQVPIVAAPSITKEQVLHDLTLNDLVWEVVTRMKDQQNVIHMNVAAALDTVRRIESKMHNGASAPVLVERKAVARIAVVGLEHNRWEPDLRRQFPSLDFLFINCDQNKKELPKTDAVFLMTKFTNHKWAKTVFGEGEHIYCCNGGLTQLILQIEDFVKSSVVPRVAGGGR